MLLFIHKDNKVVGEKRVRKLGFNPRNSFLVFLGAFMIAAFAFSSCFESNAPTLNSSAETSRMDLDLDVKTIIGFRLTKDRFFLDITPTVDGSFAYDTSSFYVTTNSQSGYTLTMSTKTEETNLRSGTAETIIHNLDQELSIDLNNPENFTMNSWGYSLNGKTSKPTFKPVPALSQVTVINQTNAPIENSRTDVTIASRANISMKAGDYINDLRFTLTTNYVENTPMFYLIKDLQDMTPEVCATVSTPTVSADGYDLTGSKMPDSMYIPQTTLRDSRDGQMYTVRRMADGNCWMADNLHIGALGPIVLTPDDTDLRPGESYTLPKSDEINSFWGNNSSSSIEKDASFHYHGHTFYNWYTVTASVGKLKFENAVAQSSLCPKGWQLPPPTGDKSIPNLIGRFGYTVMSPELAAEPFSFVSTGYHDSTSLPTSTDGFMELGSAFYHTNTAYVNSRSYTFVTNNNTTSVMERWNGYEARCVLR